MPEVKDERHYREVLLDEIFGEDREDIVRMSKDILSAGAKLGDREARFLVDTYYQMQDNRIRSAHRKRSLSKFDEPNSAVEWLEQQQLVLEKQIKNALDRYSKSNPIGIWMRSIRGIGPVLSSGFLAHIKDIKQFSRLGNLYSYSGVAPGKDRRVSGTKITYNPAMKRLMFLTGECFKRCSPDHEDAFYRGLYDQRKAYEIRKNELGEYVEYAKESMRQKKYSKSTQAYGYYSGEWVRDTPEYRKAYDALAKSGKYGAAEVIEDEEEAVMSAMVEEEIGDQAEVTKTRRSNKKIHEALLDQFPLRPKLSPSHIDRRASRWAAKMFLSHLYQVWWEWEVKTPTPGLYVYDIMKHDERERIQPPITIEQALSNAGVTSLDTIK